MDTIVIINPERSEKRDDWRFLFQVSVQSTVWTYLTTDLRKWSRWSITDWRNNFSSFFEIQDSEKKLLGLIGFSTNGISLFDSWYTNRKDFTIDRSSEKYQSIERIERESRTSNTVDWENTLRLKSLWDSLNSSWPQDALD